MSQYDPILLKGPSGRGSDKQVAMSTVYGITTAVCKGIEVALSEIARLSHDEDVDSYQLYMLNEIGNLCEHYKREMNERNSC